jgi:hypothetical protein
VIEYDGELYGLEIKATSTPTPHHADGLVKWMALAGERAHGAVACRVDAPRSLRKTTDAWCSLARWKVANAFS